MTRPYVLVHLAAIAALCVAPALLGAQLTTPRTRATSTSLTTTAASVRATLEKVIHQKTLANGLQVIVIENHGVPLATVEIDVKNGAFTQSPEYEGLAHMYEHMFFKANDAYPEPDAFVDHAADLGAVFNGTTKEESVSYYLTLPSDSLAGALRFMAAALRGPLFLSSELAREK